MVESGEFEVCSTEGQLCSFSAVNHEKFVSEVDYLGGWLVSQGGLGASAAEEVDVEFFHVAKVSEIGKICVILCSQKLECRRAMHTREEKLAAFGRLLDVLDELRVKCPWDRKQTNESLRPNTIEETYELCDALIRNDKKEICKELGDVLLHVCFYAKIGSESGEFDIADVCSRLCEKLIFRHPHVFPPEESAQCGGGVVETETQVSEQWEHLKQREKDGNKSVLSGVPSSLPSLIKAYRIQEKARNVGFDWEERSQVWSKVKEEIGEFEAEVGVMDKERAEAEFGDVLFSLINAARLYKINPDNALERTNQKFIRRFNYLEAHTLKQGRDLAQMSLAEMDAIWEEAKKLEGGSGE